MGKSHHIFESLFKMKPFSEEARLYLEQVAPDHPYFSPLQFFHLQQMPSNTEACSLQMARTTLLFNNAHWLNFQLEENDAIAGSEEENISTTNEDDVAKIEERCGVLEAAESRVLEESTVDNGNTIDHEKSFETQNALPNPETSLHLPTANHFNENENILNQDNLDSLFAKPNEELIEKAEPGRNKTEEQVSEGENESIDSSVTANEPGILPGEEPALNETIAIHPDETKVEAPSVNKDEASDAEHRFNSGGTLTETVSEDHNDTEVRKENPDNSVESTSDRSIEHTQHSGNEDELPLDADDAPNGKPLDFKLKLEPLSTEQKDITFEPLHTTDYFASQGIRLSGEIKPTDKLGKQLKSFTEWLKTMKKIHTDKLEQSSGQADKVIQTLAEKSNTEDEVLTEAMAEVLIQQGKAEKAIDVYKKLSLLSPSKNAYFAAKIDQLKQ